MIQNNLYNTLFTEQEASIAYKKIKKETLIYVRYTKAFCTIDIG
jgi:hypothetical protein